MQKNWYRLDTAALIFPAVARKNWRNVVRFSATLHEPTDPEILQLAVDDLRPRFPSFYAALRRGAFWYYLEESSERVLVQPDYAYPLTLMSGKEMRKNCLRVLYHQNRIAVEFFHVLTDGRGGTVFLSSLIARYLELKYRIKIPEEGAVRDCTKPPLKEELEDSFLKHSAETAVTEREPLAYLVKGEEEPEGFLNLITGILDTSQLVDCAHRYQVTVTAFLAGVMAECLIAMQDKETPKRKQKPVKITVPIDLRQLFKSRTLRNFALVLNLGVDPRYGKYSLKDLCRIIYHQLYAEATPQYMAAKIAANVLPQRVAAIRLTPVFLKNYIMNRVYLRRGERCGCLNITNLTELKLPEIMGEYIQRVEMIISPQRSYPNNCAVISFGGKTCINMIRNIREAELERRFFSRLVELGIAVDIESNKRAENGESDRVCTV